MTYDEDTNGIDDQAIAETAQNFRRGAVEGQHKTFAPSVAEFCIEARRLAKLLPFRGKQALPPPSKYQPHRHDDLKTRIRMSFKMSVLSASFALKGGPDMVAEANRRGLEDMIALGQQFGVPVPEELWDQIKTAA